MRKAIRAELAMIEPHDSLEREHLAEAFAWVDFVPAQPVGAPLHVSSRNLTSLGRTNDVPPEATDSRRPSSLTRAPP